MVELSRRTLFRYTRTGALSVGIMAIATACSRAATPKATPSATPTSASPTPTLTPTLAIAGADPELASVVAAHYGGKAVGEATATQGTWRGQAVAVVTFGEDVTLSVKEATWRIVGGWWPSIGRAEPELGGKPRFMLALGSDARPGEDVGRSRGDAIHVLGIDGAGGGGVLGLARDLWVPLAGGGQGKLNSALTFGGPDGFLETVKALTGVPIEGYVVTGFQGFEAMIDEWGGIPIFIPKAVTEKGQLVIPEGNNHFAGAAALDYARLRHDLPNGDFDRSLHQGELVLAAAIKARMAGIGSVPASLSIADKQVLTNLSAEQVLTFAAAFYRLDPTQVSQFVGKGGFGTSSDGQSIVLLDDESRGKFAQFASTGRF